MPVDPLVKSRVNLAAIPSNDNPYVLEDEEVVAVVDVVEDGPNGANLVKSFNTDGNSPLPVAEMVSSSAAKHSWMVGKEVIVVTVAKIVERNHRRLWQEEDDVAV